LNDFFFARFQMGMSLAFHIIFAVIGMAMPLLMAVSEGCYLWTKKPIYLELSKRWAAGTTILFAIGAVSGTVLSFELGLLWPKFMQYAGGLIGIPFSLEGFAFFTDQWPNVSLVHWSFDIMVGTGFAMLAVAAWVAWSWWRTRRLPDNKWLPRGLVCCSPFGFIALETGWFVTELGRQPWIIYGIMRTKDAVTPMPGLVVPFTTFTIVYLLLAVIVIFLLRRQFMETHPHWIKKEPLLQH
jgi:cytochrome bd-type quinol oxidase subunit 1